MKLTIENVEKAINANKHLFKAGTTISEKDMCTVAGTKYRQRFSSVEARYQHQMRKLYIYTRFNKVLALRGLYIKAHNYYSTFEVLTANDTPDRVTAYTRESKAKHKKSITLAKGITHFHSKWKPLSIAERNSLE